MPLDNESCPVRPNWSGHVLPHVAALILALLLSSQVGCASKSTGNLVDGGRLTPDNDQSMRLASDKVRMLYSEMVRRSKERPASSEIKHVMYVGCIGLSGNLDTFMGGGISGDRASDAYCIEVPHDPSQQSNVASLWEYYIGADENHAFRSGLLAWCNGRWTSGEELLSPEQRDEIKALRKTFHLD